MDTTLYLSFLLVSAGLIIIPGPNVLVIVSTSIQYGKAQGLKTVAGTSVAMLIQLFIAAAGTSLFIQFITNGIHILKWIGVLYLVYLGLINFKLAISADKRTLQVTSMASFSKGFLISLTNPKTIIFFTAFLPQFVSMPGDYTQQIVVLSATFLMLAIIFDSAYALLAHKVNVLLAGRNLRNIQHRLSGSLYLMAALWLALMRRSQ
jgi:threonine/homoserine/homoserine lactone efflux protein